ncbi:MAG TPA: potassium/proton antiporter [Frankiaceae bacterium]|jgi:cell volume regulation protein A|nr:potassium/proton antiporter [Frankiaceae bacterium]
MGGDATTTALLAGALVLVAAVTAVRLSTRLGLPTLLVYLGLGVLLGESGLGVRFDDARLAHDLGFVALVVILVEGGLTTRWADLRRALPRAASLSTVGIGVSVGIVAFAARAILGWDWTLALLLGAVLAPTDAAAVFATLRGLPVRERIVQTLEAESGTNDPLSVILVVGLSTGWHGGGPVAVVADIGYEIAIGALLGVAVGWAGRAYLDRVALPASGLYPLTVIAFAMVAYAGTAYVGGSGFVAVYVAAVVLGNSPLRHRAATLGFAEGLAWLAQIGLFVMLGLLASPGRLGGAVLPALAIGLVLTLVARPLSVLLALAPFRGGWAEKSFVAWAGLRGAVPIVLTTVPLTEGVPRADDLFDVVFVLVAVFTLLHSPTLGVVGRRLRVTTEPRPRDLTLEAAPLGALDADMLHLAIGPRSGLNGAEVWELRLPPKTAVTLVVRDGESFVPDRWTRLRHGDELLVIVPHAQRGAVERRLRRVSRDGPLEGWRRR